MDWEWKSTGILKGQKRNSVVELGTERAVNAEANVSVEHIIIISHKISSAF